MKNILKAIILITIIIIIIIIILILRTRDTSFMYGNEYGADDTTFEEMQVDLTRENSKNNYYIIKTIVENYYLYLSKFNLEDDDERIFIQGRASTQEELEAERAEYRKKVYNLLSDEYIAKYNITIENIESKLGSFHDLAVFTNDIYYKDASETIMEYFIEGCVVERKTLAKTEFSMKIILDVNNGSFEIYPNGYGYNEIENQNEIKKESVANKIDNVYNFRNINDDIHVKEMFRRNINRLKYDAEGVYNTLDKEYREKRFGSLNDFKEYTKNNYAPQNNVQLDKYQVTNQNGYTRYVCIDTNGNYYIFRETDIMKYTLILDTYTIDIPEFVNKYEKAKPQEKVILNINKFLLAINDKNYKYAYSILADSFKENNFKTFESFENYIKENFFEKNTFEYKEFGDEANTYYTYKVNVKDETGMSTDVHTKTFIILLEEETNFKLSFNIN